MSGNQDNGEVGNQISAQEKLQDLQKKLRNAESDRKAYADEVAANIKKQRTKIDNLKKENYALKEYIAKINDNVLSRTQTNMNRNVNMEQVAEEFKKKIGEETEKLDKIERNIKIFDKQIVTQKGAIGGVNAGQENQNSLVKQIKILENRLDKANQKFNEAISVNKNLRQQIDSLRRERVIFDNLYKKLEKELHDKRKKMAEIIETANSAYEERDKANDQIENLKQQAKREAKDFENELKELSQLAEKNRKTQEYIKMVKLKKDDQNTAHDQIDSEKISNKKSQKLFKERIFDQKLIEQHKKLELDYAKIQAATNIRSFNDLIKNFIEIEENNFNKFKYVNDLSNQIENEEKTITEYKEEKRRYEGKGNELTIQKKRYLKELEEKSSNSRDKTELFESKSMAGQRSLNSVFALIETLFNTIECDKSLAKEINATQGVSESNIMNYMGIIEDRVTEILHAYGIIMSNKDIKNVQINLDGPRGDGDHKHALKEMPSCDDQELEDDEGEYVKPLTYDQLRLKALEKQDAKDTKKANTKQKKKNKGS